jgi:homoserine kinase
VEETGRFAVHTDLRIARDRRNLAVRAFETLHPADDFEFTIRSQMPLSGGLGTSAAAYVAGLMAADSIFELDVALLPAATRLEGHPDNAAAALLGGFVACVGDRAARFEVPAGLEAILVVPHKSVRTVRARAAMPAQVPLTDAVHNVGHASLLVLGLLQGDWDLVAAGLHDRLHQPRRASLYPQSMALLRRAGDLGALGATISGAGPSVLVWTHYETTGAVMAKLKPATAGWAQVMHVPFEPQGAFVREL